MTFALSSLETGISVAQMTGRLDMKATNEFGDQFALTVGNAKDSVIVDLAEVDFLASIGMRMLISAARSLKNRGRKMVLCSPTAEVKEALMVAGFDELIPICDDREAAIVLIQTTAP